MVLFEIHSEVMFTKEWVNVCLINNSNVLVDKINNNRQVYLVINITLGRSFLCYSMFRVFWNFGVHKHDQVSINMILNFENENENEFCFIANIAHRFANDVLYSRGFRGRIYMLF